MDLANKQVIHKIFGKGKIVKHDDSYIKIDFPSGNKEFVFPDAFEKFLTLTDQKAARMVQKKKREHKERERERERKLEELRIEQKKERQRFLAQDRRIESQRRRKIHPSSQAVFWCKGQERDSVFEEWEIFTGVIKSGEREGRPRRLARMDQNSACLLTVRASDQPEKERRIIGAFMVAEAFNNKLCMDGYIPAHLEYRLQLSEQETEKMLFWNYYLNKRNQHKVTWNTGRHRYFDNLWMAQILRDIISLKEEPTGQDLARRFFNYFCEMNQIEEEEIPSPAGALIQQA